MRFLLLLLAALPAFAQVQSAKVHYGDDLRWANPDFDDSGWGDGNAEIDLQKHVLETYYWVRYKVRIPDRILDPVVGTHVTIAEAYIDGHLVGSNGHFPPNLQDTQQVFLAWPIPEDLAKPGRVVTVALRLWQYPGRDLRRLTGFKAALPLSLVNAVEVPIYVAQDRSILRGRLWGTGIITLLLCFLLMGGKSQWKQREFQLLTCYLFLQIMAASSYTVSFYLPIGIRTFAYTYIINGVGYVVQLELLAHFAGVRPAWWFRIPQGLTGMYFVAVGWAALLIEGPAWLPVVVSGSSWVFGGTVLAVAAILILQRTQELTARLLTICLAAVCLADIARIAGGASGIPIGDATFTRNLLGNILFSAVFVAVRMYRLRNAEATAARLEGQFAAARGVQEMLLTRGDAVTPHYEIETAYSPAEEVGGDFFRIIEAHDGATLVVVGDVSGKGLRAAMLVSVIAGILLNRKSDEPAGVLDELNRALQGQMDGGFATCCAALFAADGTVIYANAGHPAAYRNGEELEAPAGLPLGVVAEAEYESASFQLQRGERVVFLSDGIPEAANASSELFGFDRTRAISGKPAREIADAAKAWGQTDDITVVAVRRSA